MEYLVVSPHLLQRLRTGALIKMPLEIPDIDPLDFFEPSHFKTAFKTALRTIRVQREEIRINSDAYRYSLESRKQLEIELANVHCELTKTREESKVLEQKIVSAQNDCISLRKSNAILKGLAKKKGK